MCCAHCQASRPRRPQEFAWRVCHAANRAVAGAYRGDVQTRPRPKAYDAWVRGAVVEGVAGGTVVRPFASPGAAGPGVRRSVDNIQTGQSVLQTSSKRCGGEELNDEPAAGSNPPPRPPGGPLQLLMMLCVLHTDMRCHGIDRPQRGIVAQDTRYMLTRGVQ